MVKLSWPGDGPLGIGIILSLDSSKPGDDVHGRGQWISGQDSPGLLNRVYLRASTTIIEPDHPGESFLNMIWLNPSS
ncbi:MAG: hypothetical protein R6X32_13140 [Chloroflexota bacterium]|jgi:hypothetical protein